ncbi:HPF/RaiA family ribosome-associated protein [Beijerinckia indica]|uniref:Cold-shock protein DNA-binding n=1 Tax=Beijerinckia indica subsp. indica (strain ATCC 9039 / DSM 1715 / NCIMB 8712) TaxID=395963 RepID=B2IJI9_BEII9|nr:cold shock domain-containing protein [Beijerinckia indica]ACB94863.1 Cold-shock protein DNA-binding [Beijerinckia indica subsp. indica ATCC 9039]
MDRPLQIVFRDLEHSASLEHLIRERAQRLEHLFRHIMGMRAVVSPAQGSETAKKALALTIEVEVPGRPLLIGKAEEARHDSKGVPMALVKHAFEAVHRQLDAIADIRRGQVKHHEGMGETGVISKLFPQQNYGFIEVRGAGDLYFTRNAVQRGDFDSMEVGNQVVITRATTEGPMGPQASSVRRVESL